MANQLLTHHELERRLLRWTGSSFVPRYPFFESALTSVISDQHLISGTQDLNRWFNDVELAAHDCDLPLEQYADAAIYFLRGDLRDVMCQRREVYLKQTKRVFWDWFDFKEDLKRIVVETDRLIGAIVTETFTMLTEEAKKMIMTPELSRLQSDMMEKLGRAHPYIASSVKLGLIIGGTAVLLPALGIMAWNKFLKQTTPAQRQTPNSPQ